MILRLLTLALVVSLGASGCALTSDEAGEAVTDIDPVENGGQTADPQDGGDSDQDAGGEDSEDGQAETDAPAPGTDPDGSGDEPAGETQDATELVWTVVGVAFDDTLNVRSEPNASAPIVTELNPWTTGLTATGNTNGSPATWRELDLDDGSTGWVNSRFVVGQPETLDAASQAELEALAGEFQLWVGGGGDSDAPRTFLAERSLWVGGIAIYADLGSEWNWIAADELSTTAAWNAPREFVVEDGFECGSDCTVSTWDFLTLDRMDDTTQILVNDVPGENQAFLEGLVWEAPASLHRVVFDTPTTDPDQTFDWQRLHAIPDWSTGEPRIHLLHNHGWTP